MKLPILPPPSTLSYATPMSGNLLKQCGHIPYLLLHSNYPLPVNWTRAANRKYSTQFGCHPVLWGGGSPHPLELRFLYAPGFVFIIIMITPASPVMDKLCSNKFNIGNLIRRQILPHNLSMININDDHLLYWTLTHYKLAGIPALSGNCGQLATP